MNKILTLLALVGAFSFLPLQTASAAHCGRGHVGVRSCGHVAYRGHVGRVYAHGAYVRGGYGYRYGAVCRPSYRYYGPRYVYHRRGIGFTVRL